MIFALLGFQLLLCAHPVLTGPPIPHTVYSTCSVFFSVVNRVCSDNGLYSFEEATCAYAVGGKSSAFKAAFLINHTEYSEGSPWTMNVHIRPASIDSERSCFVDSMIQFVNQMCIIKKQFVFDLAYAYATDHSYIDLTEYGPTDPTNVFENVRRSMKCLLDMFFTTTETGPAAPVYSAVVAARASQNQSALYASMVDTMRLCFKLNKYKEVSTATVSPPPRQDRYCKRRSDNIIVG